MPSGATAALPMAQRILRAETNTPDRAASQVQAVWTWIPAAPGDAAPLDSRLHPHDRLSVGRSWRRCSWASRLRHAARTCSSSSSFPSPRSSLLSHRTPELIFHAFGIPAVAISPSVLAVAGLCAVWTYLAWRHHERWLALLAARGRAPQASFGLMAIRLLQAMAQQLVAAIPRDSYGWGTLTVIAAFVLLAARFPPQPRRWGAAATRAESPGSGREAHSQRSTQCVRSNAEWAETGPFERHS